MFTSGKNKSAVIYTFVLVFLCQILRPFHLSAVESSLRILVAIDQVLWYVDLLGVLQAEEKLIFLHVRWVFDLCIYIYIHMNLY